MLVLISSQVISSAAEAGDSFLFSKTGAHYRLPDGRALMIFETMIFGGKHDQDQWRYSTWDEAVEGHRKAVLIAENTLDQKEQS